MTKSMSKLQITFCSAVSTSALSIDGHFSPITPCTSATTKVTPQSPKSPVKTTCGSSVVTKFLPRFPQSSIDQKKKPRSQARVLTSTQFMAQFREKNEKKQKEAEE